MSASRFREADLLCQLGADALAAQRLAPLTSAEVPQSPRLAALGRLTEIACNLGELAAAERHLGEMRRATESPRETPAVSDRAEAEYAMGRYAFSRRDATALERSAGDLLRSAAESAGDVRVSSIAIRLGSYLAVDRYHRRNLAGVSEAAATAARLLRGTPGASPAAKTHALTTRGVIDLHDPSRARLATAENVEALEIALANGMTSTAQDALFNIVNFHLYCDAWHASAYESRIVRESLD